VEAKVIDIPEAIAKDGFAIVPGVLDQHDVSRVLRNLSEAQLRRSRAGIRHLLSDGNVLDLAKDPRLIQLASGSLAAAAIPFRATLFDKSPDANWMVVWHQDTALPLRDRVEKPGWGPWSVKEGITYAHAPTSALDKVVALRIHLDASTELNGLLRVLPGTHRLGVLADDEVSKLSAERTPVDCLAAQGTVLVMRPLLIHSSSKAQIEAPRRVLHIEYASSMFVDEGMELAIA
jgi:ectoine hydroxylase-related dioxygenase (phytanoyl-CoA dioxygenase family)